jgi:hypothetical protein
MNASPFVIPTSLAAIASAATSFVAAVLMLIGLRYR